MHPIYIYIHNVFECSFECVSHTVRAYDSVRTRVCENVYICIYLCIYIYIVKLS